MYKLLICHRRKTGVGYGQFTTHWQEKRSRLVGDLRDGLGYSQYGQIHQVSRRNLLYQVIRFSRSPMLTGLIARLQGTRLPASSSGPHASREEHWDIVEEFRYPGQEAAAKALTAESGVQAIERLAADQMPLVSRVAVVSSDEFTIATDPEPPNPQIKTIFCLRSRSDLTRQQMLAYWGTNHKDLVLSVQKAMGFRAYNQLHVRSQPEVSAAVQAMSVNAGDEYDGVADLTYRSQGQILLGLFRPATQIANLKLIKDEITFIDMQRSVLVFGRHYTFAPAH